MEATSHLERLPVKASLAAESVGYLVPRSHFDGVVHSIYARACNIAHGQSLLMLLAPGAAEGPTTLLLNSEYEVDLRTCFRVGDAVVRRGARLRSHGADVDLGRAIEWHPDTRRALARPSQVFANLRIASARLAARPRCQTSIVDREGRATCASLERACRVCDFEMALPEAARLIGWGEGSTPAGDDFLVGLMGALDALAAASAARGSFLSRLGAAIDERAGLTTPVSAHYLRLGARGHFTADLHRLRDALLSADDATSLQRSVDKVLALGATSGADLAAGLLSGVSAWVEPPLPAESRS